MRWTDAIRYVRARRAALAEEFDPKRSLSELEESCIPSYLHPNPLAAGVAWWRLFAAADLYEEFAPVGPVLDFGAGSGELRGLLRGRPEHYAFIEGDEALARHIESTRPAALRTTLEQMPQDAYAAIFALDALEHNDDVGSIIDVLAKGLRPDGVLLISGPTENALYRAGRLIAGFSGHYHKTNIWQIEEVAKTKLRPVRRRLVPVGLPLFSISAWCRNGADSPSL